jgi:hypothetical protein
MDLSVKEAGAIAGWLLSLGAMYTWVKTKIKNHDVGLVEVKDHALRLVAVEGYGPRVDKLESRFVTENGEPALLSYRAHDHICNQKNEALYVEMRHIVKAMNNHSQTVKDNSDQVAGLAIAVAVLEEKVVRV